MDGTSTAIGWMSSTERLEEDGTIEICVEGGQIWKKGDCGPLKLENLLLYNDEGDIIDRYEGEILVFQCPADFQPVSAQFTGDFVDETETMANRIVIGVEVSIQTPGEYVISGLLEDDDGFEIDSVEKGVDLVAGEQTVLLEFNPIRFIMKQKESRLHLKNLLLSRNGEEIDRLEDVWSTEVYAPGDFTTIRKMYVI